MKYLSQFDVLQIRTRLQVTARQSFDLMNASSLHAALAAPRQAVFGQEMHSGVLPKAAILFARLIQNHPFYDGNKRIAVNALRLFLVRNHYLLGASDTDALTVAQRIATGDANEHAVADWLEEHTTRQVE